MPICVYIESGAAQMSARTDASDKSAWIQSFPTEVFDWAQSEWQRTVGGVTFGWLEQPSSTCCREWLSSRYFLPTIAFHSFPSEEACRLCSLPFCEPCRANVAGTSFARRLNALLTLYRLV